MKDTYNFNYVYDLRYFIGLLLDGYCPTQLQIFDSDVVYDAIEILKESDTELTGNQIFQESCILCNDQLNADLDELKEDLTYRNMEAFSEIEKEIVKDFLDAYEGNYNLIDYNCDGTESYILIRNNLTGIEKAACQIIDKYFEVFKNLEERVDIDLFNIRNKELSIETNEIEESKEHEELERERE